MLKACTMSSPPLTQRSQQLKHFREDRKKETEKEKIKEQK